MITKPDDPDAPLTEADSLRQRSEEYMQGLRDRCETFFQDQATRRQAEETAKADDSKPKGRRGRGGTK
ncbi:hypothetical protein FO488_15965 [Geobacter sp. FeAm09]|uniref:hypothetical protein n=1 Tax=Geobacter sp. FeAm09 TaxID=2597769 RepID=UPI0011EF121A|nr:hypothetical protein [Geobacter sp. FeAm09]QEM69504.1 hypothetical protein FO488_15965 [Geobacter sp. FeAm09]